MCIHSCNNLQKQQAFNQFWQFVGIFHSTPDQTQSRQGVAQESPQGIIPLSPCGVRVGQFQAGGYPFFLSFFPRQPQVIAVDFVSEMGCNFLKTSPCFNIFIKFISFNWAFDLEQNEDCWFCPYHIQWKQWNKCSHWPRENKPWICPLSPQTLFKLSIIKPILPQWKSLMWQ